MEWAGLAGSPTSKGGLRRGARVQESGAVQELFSGETYLDIPLRGAILHTTRLGILWIALHVQVVVRKAVKTNGVLGLIGRDMACPSGDRCWPTCLCRTSDAANTGANCGCNRDLGPGPPREERHCRPPARGVCSQRITLSVSQRLDSRRWIDSRVYRGSTRTLQSLPSQGARHLAPAGDMYQRRRSR